MKNIKLKYFQFTWVEVIVWLGLAQAGADLSDPARQEGEQVGPAGHAGLYVDGPGLAVGQHQREAQQDN